MDVLFITSSRLGDAVLSTGLADHIARTYADARFTVVCGGLAAPLFEGLPGRTETIILKKQKYNRHWFDLWKQVKNRRWGMVVDLRDSIVSRVVRADRRYIFSKHIDKNTHKVRQNAAVMKLAAVPSPRLWITNEQAKAARELVPDGGPVLGVGPTANWIGKTWPADRFIELVARITAADGELPGARVAVFAAPGEEVGAYKVLRSLPAARQIDVIGKADPGTAAAALARCALYVGNDSGLMHCAAAVGVSTFGLFGPSWPHIYGPWGDHAAYIATAQNFAELTDFEGYSAKTLDRSLMLGLDVDTVARDLRRFWDVQKGNGHDRCAG